MIKFALWISVPLAFKLRYEEIFEICWTELELDDN